MFNLIIKTIVIVIVVCATLSFLYAAILNPILFGVALFVLIPFSIGYIQFNMDMTN